MRRPNQAPASSGWGWNTQSAPAPRPPRGPSPPRRGSTEAVLAAVVFLVLAVLGAGAYFLTTSGDSETPVASAEESQAKEGDRPATPEPPEKSAGAAPGAAPIETTPTAPSLDTIVWTTSAASTLPELARAWSIPNTVLTTLNPGLPPRGPIEAGVRVVVHSKTLGASISIGPPNNGRLTRGVPLPESKAWALPEDRGRAFATAETIAAVTAGLHVYARQYPGAEPIQIGDLSARRGGKIYGHQSHQSGLDVDIRLIKSTTDDGFDAARNWFLVKTLIVGASGADEAAAVERSNVRAIFLNRTEQTWLRAAAEADVGAVLAEQYFALIRHEPGHTIHMHVRFACAEQHKRCVGYSLPDSDEQDPKPAGKLPPGSGAKPGRGGTKRSRLTPKGGKKSSAKKNKGKKKKRAKAGK